MPTKTKRMSSLSRQYVIYGGTFLPRLIRRFRLPLFQLQYPALLRLCLYWLIQVQAHWKNYQSLSMDICIHGNMNGQNIW